MADTGTGDFARLSPQMADLMKSKTLKGKVFETGEIVRVKESMFRITNIGRHTLTLRLIPDDNNQQIPKP